MNEMRVFGREALSLLQCTLDSNFGEELQSSRKRFLSLLEVGKRFQAEG